MTAMIVTSVTEYGRGKYKIYLDEEFAFVLYKGELLRYGIEQGKELPEDLISDIRDKVLLKRAKLRAMNLLKSRDYTEAALRRKLLESLYPAEVVEQALKYVKPYGYIDDLRYAQSYIRSNIGTRSRRDIIGKLKSRGVPDEFINEAFEAEGPFEDEEEELLRRLILKKCPEPEDLDNAGKQKLYAYLYGRGFDPHSVDKALRALDITY